MAGMKKRNTGEKVRLQIELSAKDAEFFREVFDRSGEMCMAGMVRHAVKVYGLLLQRAETMETTVKLVYPNGHTETVVLV